MSTVELTLHLDGSPAPIEIMQALRRVQVERGDEAPDTFQLSFALNRAAGSVDFDLLLLSQLEPFKRVILEVSVESSPSVLFDGYITQQQLAPSDQEPGTTLTVSGEDVSVKMGMFELSLEYPSMGDFLICEAVLAKYLLVGITPSVTPTVTSVIPLDFVPQQNCTDRDYVKQLAAKNGYRFYIKPGPQVGSSTAYWGPPEYDATPQRALTVDMGPSTNVKSIQFSYNGMAPTMTYGAVQQDFIPPIPIPVMALSSTRSPELSADPALGTYGGLAKDLLLDPLSIMSKILSLETRGSLFQHQGLGVISAELLAQSQTNQSTDDVVTVEGTLETERYGEVIDAPGVIAVRGAGHRFNGLYYIKKVVHVMNTVQGNWAYEQKFTLSRDGSGSTIEEVSDHDP
ncbi:MAG: hypothetical protein AAGF23_04270 [Acidobacteriota bacterium]